MRKLTVTLVLAFTILASAPAEAAPAPHVSARLHCGSAHTVLVAASYRLPTRAHAVWLTATESYEGLRLYLAKRARVRAGETWRADNLVGQGAVHGVVVRFVVRHKTIRWRLPAIRC